MATVATQKLAVGDVLLRAAIEGIIPLLPGSKAAEILARDLVLPLARSAFSWLKERTQDERQAAIEGLATLSVANARSTVQTVLCENGVELAGAASLVSFLSTLPMTTKQALVRHDDMGQVTALLSSLPNSAEDFLRYVPLRAPLFEPGHKLQGRDVTLEELVGQGGCGEVWRASHPFFKEVAIKFCAPEHREGLDRELQLAEILRARPHPGIVTLLDTGLNAAEPFLQYEYVAGGNLAGWVAGFGGKPPSERDVLRILRMTAEALAVAHDCGVVHGDLKPSNLLLARDGRVKIADFGIGFLASDNDSASTLVHQTQLAGACTPLYADGLRRNGQRDRKIDLYALGVVAYQLLIGDVTRPLPPYWKVELRKLGVTSDTMDVVERCVTSPEERYGHAQELLAAVVALVEPVRAPVVQVAPSAPAPAGSSWFAKVFRLCAAGAFYWAVSALPVLCIAHALHGRSTSGARTACTFGFVVYGAAWAFTTRRARVGRAQLGWLRTRTLKWALTVSIACFALSFLAVL